MYIETLARTKSIAPLKPKQPQPDGAMIVAGDAQIILPLDSLGDIEGEIKRANKELDALKKRIARSSEKLSNRGFVEKAPAAGWLRKKKRNWMNCSQSKPNWSGSWRGLAPTNPSRPFQSHEPPSVG